MGGIAFPCLSVLVLFASTLLFTNDMNGCGGSKGTIPPTVGKFDTSS
jgi:hypothetical protein